MNSKFNILSKQYFTIVGFDQFHVEVLYQSVDLCNKSTAILGKQSYKLKNFKPYYTLRL